MKKNIAIIPIRKGSKGIPNKNKRKFLGKPLYSWVLSAAIFSKLDAIYVYSDDSELIELINIEYHLYPNVITIFRPEYTATDNASTESAMLQFVDSIKENFYTITLLQVTSPLTTSEDINKSLEMISEKKYESSLSVVRLKRFLWNKNGTALNYDIYKRPRRQEFEGTLVENGAIYTTLKENFIESSNRISSNIGLLEMEEDTFYEIDTIDDWIIVEQLLIKRLKSKKKNSLIKYLVLDVDGVFTDGSVYFNSDGEFLKKFDMRDGMGLELIRETGVEIIVMTSENSKLVKARMDKLKIREVYFGVKDKHTLMKKLIIDKKTSIDSFAYIGDDINDLANICASGWSFAPANATELIKANADVILKNDSGKKAIRETTEFIIKFNKRYDSKI